MKIYVNDNLLASEIRLADSFKSKLIGLLNKKSLDNNEGLFLRNCSSIHCFFMKITIDAIYLSKDMKVLYKETIKPWGIGKLVKNCYHVLELAEGMAKDIEIGDYISMSF
ncbi:MAG: DUF192 domain-containing protein [Bacteroidales bacterium]|nr:DUF192 domain-containing protein [Bacteroidales bacterium]